MNERISKITLSIAIFSVLLTAGAFVFVFNIIQSKNTRIAESSVLLENAVNSEQRLKETKKLLADTSGDVSAVETYIIGQDDVADFVTLLEKNAVEIGVSEETKSVDIDKNTKASDPLYEYVKVSVDTVGSWKDNMEFLSRVETLPYKIDVNRVTLEKQSADTSVVQKGKKVSSENLWKLSMDIIALKKK